MRISLFRRLAVLSSFFAAIAIAAAAPPASSRDAVATFGDGGEILIVTLHGDLSFGFPASYHYGLAELAAASVPGSTGAGLLRPGYEDGLGRVAPGSDLGREDNYTRAAVDAIARSIAELRESGGYEHVIAVGHSGGAAIIATMMALHPGLVDSAVLVSCPCHVPNWRRHVRSGRGGRDGMEVDWHRSLSPHRHLDGMAPGARIVAITSRSDSLTPPSLARAYVKALRGRGVAARFVETRAPGHLLSNLMNVVLQEVKTEAQALR